MEVCRPVNASCTIRTGTSGRARPLAKEPRTRSGIGFAELLDALYASALGPDEGWDDCLRLLAEAMGGVGPGLSFVRPGGGVRMWSLDIPQPRVDDWHERFAGPLEAAAYRHGLDRVFLASELWSIPVWDEFQEDWIRPQGFADLVQGHEVHDGALYGFGLFREHGAEPFGAQQIALMERLKPHFVRVLQLHERMGAVADAADVATAALDRLSIGFVLLDRSARVVEVSPGAQRILSAADGLDVQGGRLHATTSDGRSVLSRLLGALTADLEHAGGSLRLPRPSGRRSYALLAMRLPAARLRLGSRTAVAVLFVTDPEEAPRLAETAVAELHDLTPSEARVATRLASGETPQEIAAVLGLTVQTVRNHLKSVFAKTDTRRQSELVGLLLRDLSRLDRR